MQKAAQIVERWLTFVTSALLVAMVVVILLQVVFRYAVNVSLAWTEEVGRYLFVWVCLLGAALAYRLASHSGYETFVRAMPERMFNWVMGGVDVTVGIFGLAMVIASADLIEAGLGQLTPATQIAIGYVYFAFPLAGALTLFFVIDALGARLRGTPRATALHVDVD